MDAPRAYVVLTRRPARVPQTARPQFDWSINNVTGDLLMWTAQRPKVRSAAQRLSALGPRRPCSN
jgi:hypothetical protein